MLTYVAWLQDWHWPQDCGNLQTGSYSVSCVHITQEQDIRHSVLRVTLTQSGVRIIVSFYFLSLDGKAKLNTLLLTDDQASGCVPDSHG